MKRILVLLLLVILITPQATEAQIVTVDSVVFYSSGINPNLSNATAGSSVTIMFFAMWNLTSEIINENDSLTVYFGADLSTEDNDWLFESEYNSSIKGFTANFTYSKTATITFYVSEVLLQDFTNVNFTQPAANLTIHWKDQVIIQPVDTESYQVLGMLLGAFAGVFVVVIIFFKKENDKRLEFENAGGRRNFKK